MNKWTIRHKANGILALSFAGMLAAFPFQGTFAGGLLFAAFSAGTIGGLADSFAVGALFGNPLGIRWPKWMGTRVISRNRDRLIGELVHMVEKDLLTVENVRQTFGEYDMADILLRYLQERGGSADVKAIARRLAAELLGGSRAEAAAGGIERFLKDHAETVRIADLLAEAGEWSVRNGYDERIVTFILLQLRKLVLMDEFRSMAEGIAESAIRSYEGDKFRRRLVDYTAGLNARDISAKVQDWLASFLEQLAETDHPQRRRLQELLRGFVTRLREDEELRSAIEDGKRRWLTAASGNIRLREWLAGRLAAAGEALRGASTGGAGDWLDSRIDEAVDALAGSPDWRQRLDESVKTALLTLLERRHVMIGRLVRDKLEQFTEEDLIELAKDKAGKDLQYIRLNGMIVGSGVGIALYLATFWIGGR